MTMASCSGEARRSFDDESATPAGPRLCEHPPGDAGRPEVEAFIRRVYAERFGADVRQFAPVLVSLRDNGEIVAAAGFRAGSCGPMFLERYLDAPVERLLDGATGRHPRRDRIVEVGHLAAARPGEGRRLIHLLGVHLSQRGFEWVVSTLTSELRHLLLRIGVTPLALGVADPAMLGPDAGRWGSYYDHRPVVLAGQLQQAMHQLARRLGGSGAGQ